MLIRMKPLAWMRWRGQDRMMNIGRMRQSANATALRCATVLLALWSPAGGSAEQGAYDSDAWWAAGAGRSFPSQADYGNELGTLRVLLAGGPLDTRGHPFFEAFGSNGRACVTCHQPSDAMSLSARSARARWDATGGQGSAVRRDRRVELPVAAAARARLAFPAARSWPDPRGATLAAARRCRACHALRTSSWRSCEIPWGCNSGPDYGPAARTPRVSVYRRPRPVANLKYLTAIGLRLRPQERPAAAARRRDRRPGVGQPHGRRACANAVRAGARRRALPP